MNAKQKKHCVKTECSFAQNMSVQESLHVYVMTIIVIMLNASHSHIKLIMTAAQTVFGGPGEDIC